MTLLREHTLGDFIGPNLGAASAGQNALANSTGLTVATTSAEAYCALRMIGVNVRPHGVIANGAPSAMLAD